MAVRAGAAMRQAWPRVGWEHATVFAWQAPFSRVNWVDHHVASPHPHPAPAHPRRRKAVEDARALLRTFTEPAGCMIHTFPRSAQLLSRQLPPSHIAKLAQQPPVRLFSRHPQRLSSLLSRCHSAFNPSFAAGALVATSALLFATYSTHQKPLLHAESSNMAPVPNGSSSEQKKHKVVSGDGSASCRLNCSPFSLLHSPGNHWLWPGWTHGRHLPRAS